MIMGRNKAQWTINQHRFVLRVVNESGHGKWATFCKKTNTWAVLDPKKALLKIKEYNEQTPSPQPPFAPALVNTSKHTWRVDDASDDENTAPAEQQQPRSPLRQILLAPVMAMMAIASPSKSKGSPHDDPLPDSPERRSSPPRSPPPCLPRVESPASRVRASQPLLPQGHGSLPPTPPPPKPTARPPSPKPTSPQAPKPPSPQAPKPACP